MNPRLFLFLHIKISSLSFFAGLSRSVLHVLFHILFLFPSTPAATSYLWLPQPAYLDASAVLIDPPGIVLLEHPHRHTKLRTESNAIVIARGFGLPWTTPLCNLTHGALMVDLLLFFP